MFENLGKLKTSRVAAEGTYSSLGARRQKPEHNLRRLLGEERTYPPDVVQHESDERCLPRQAEQHSFVQVWLQEVWRHPLRDVSQTEILAATWVLDRAKDRSS